MSTDTYPPPRLKESPVFDPFIRLRGVEKTYPAPGGPFAALTSITMDIAAGDFVAVTGASGSGKSTLLNLIGGLDRPTRGEIRVGPTLVHELDENALSIWRGRYVGIVFQFFQLLPTLTCLENVMLAMDFLGVVPGRDRPQRALALLDRMGVADQARKLPALLSGGQQQRVAIARALANDPPLIVADEPTGNLDSRTSRQVIELFARLAADGRTVVMVTHEREAASIASRTITLVDGAIVPAHERDALKEPCHA